MDEGLRRGQPAPREHQFLAGYARVRAGGRPGFAPETTRAWQKQPHSSAPRVVSSAAASIGQELDNFLRRKAQPQACRRMRRQGFTPSPSAWSLPRASEPARCSAPVLCSAARGTARGRKTVCEDHATPSARRYALAAGAESRVVLFVVVSSACTLHRGRALSCASKHRGGSVGHPCRKETASCGTGGSLAHLLDWLEWDAPLEQRLRGFT